MAITESAVDQPAKSRPPESLPADKPAVTSDLAVDEFFTQLQSDMRRPDLSQEAIAAAFQAIQKLALDSGAEEAAQSVTAKSKPAGANTCPACHASNSAESRFCSACGLLLQQPGGETAAANAASQPAGDHHYHHHYHHHYFPASNGVGPASATDFRPPVSAAIPRDAPKTPRGPAGTTTLSRAEAAVRRMTQDWAQACNTKQLDDLVELYATDALVLRANLSPHSRHCCDPRILFCRAGRGLGDAEFEPLRVEVFGDIAFEAGRCKTLVPVAVGKRREERGKYLIIYVRQPAGDWKALVDCWSSDLSLGSRARP